jgi:UDP-N-acetylmuramyl pentapeptide phosphotransferase/UDP-N-acetylglucosamine-1-phosphate transferase
MILALVITLALAVVVTGNNGAAMTAEGLLAGGALLLSLVGYRDDAVGVPAPLRFLLQVLAASILTFTLDVTGIFWAVLLVLWLTWTMNAFNFMDGSDGMAGVQGAFSGLLLAWAFLREPGAGEMAVMAAAVAGVCAGFLPWNLPAARVFMGDAGSVPLGWLIGGLGVTGAVAGVIAWPLVVLVLAPFHVDAGLTLLARIRRGERWYTAHRTHVYQRLIAQGWTHGQVLLAYTALNLTIVAPAALLGMNRTDWAWWLAATALGLMVAGWCIVSLKLGKRP